MFSEDNMGTPCRASLANPLLKPQPQFTTYGYIEQYKEHSEVTSVVFCIPVSTLIALIIWIKASSKS